MPGFVLQASDRRVTDLFTGTLMDSKTNKSIVLDNRVSFGYTGLAQLEGEETDWWLTTVLSALPKDMVIGDVLSHVAQRATIATRKAWIPQANRHLAFVGAGWAVP